MLKISILLFCFIITSIQSARILVVIPTPSYSHNIVFRPLIKELLGKGHQVTVITTDSEISKDPVQKNLTVIDLHGISYKAWQTNYVPEITKHSTTITEKLSASFDTLVKVFEAQMRTKEVQEIIQKKRGDFDLLILEACAKQSLVFSHIYKVPVIQISSLGGLSFNYKTVGSLTHPFLYPSLLQDKLYNLTKYEKMQQFFFNYILSERVMMELEEKEDVSLKKLFGLDIPPLNELANNIDLLFLNVHPMWIDNQPVPPNVVYIGGIHIRPRQEIPKELLSYLDSSTNGVIYISFGSSVQPSLLPPEKIAILVNIFSQLPFNILWKWDKNVLPGQTKNIKIVKWIPQIDVLHHPNIKLFITQCGLQSTEEAIDAGVPLLGIPFHGDQFYNAEKYIHHKIGLKLNINSLTEKIFREAIDTIVTKNSYRENIIRLRNLMQDQPESSLERAIWWIDYTLRHGGAKHLRARGANISWSEYLELELVFTVLCILVLLLVLITFTAYCAWVILSKNRVSFKIKRA